MYKLIIQETLVLALKFWKESFDWEGKSHTPSSMILPPIFRLETLRRQSRIAVALPDPIGEKTLQGDLLDRVIPCAYSSFGSAFEHGRLGR